jgi:hypothetical protein
VKEEDYIVAKVIANSPLAFNSYPYFTGAVGRQHIIDYLERNEVIHTWNVDFLVAVVTKADEAKAFLLK